MTSELASGCASGIRVHAEANVLAMETGEIVLKYVVPAIGATFANGIYFSSMFGKLLV